MEPAENKHADALTMRIICSIYIGLWYSHNACVHEGMRTLPQSSARMSSARAQIASHILEWPFLIYYPVTQHHTKASTEGKF